MSVWLLWLWSAKIWQSHLLMWYLLLIHQSFSHVIGEINSIHTTYDGPAHWQYIQKAIEARYLVARLLRMCSFCLRFSDLWARSWMHWKYGNRSPVNNFLETLMFVNNKRLQINNRTSTKINEKHVRMNLKKNRNISAHFPFTPLCMTCEACFRHMCVCVFDNKANENKNLDMKRENSIFVYISETKTAPSHSIRFVYLTLQRSENFSLKYNKRRHTTPIAYL